MGNMTKESRCPSRSSHHEVLWAVLFASTFDLGRESTKRLELFQLAHQDSALGLQRGSIDEGFDSSERGRVLRQHLFRKLRSNVFTQPQSSLEQFDGPDEGSCFHRLRIGRMVLNGRAWLGFHDFLGLLVISITSGYATFGPSPFRSANLFGCLLIRLCLGGRPAANGH